MVSIFKTTLLAPTIKYHSNALSSNGLAKVNNKPWWIFFGKFLCTVSIITIVFNQSAVADHDQIDASGHPSDIRADGHGPIGVMGDHIHKSGEWMISYRFMRMWMEGNRDGTNSIQPDEIVTTVNNRFANEAGQPNTLRVVPLRMYMDMHMLGAMYAPSDRVTFMAMGQYLYKDMDHITYQGGAGTTIRGSFTTRSVGIGDTKLSALIKILKSTSHHLHLNVGLSIPTGSITKEDEIFKPNGTNRRERLPYPMQLGSGTIDLLPGLTYSGKSQQLGWGGQISSVLRTSENDQNYSIGDEHKITGWTSYMWRPWVSTSIRMSGQYSGKIDGIDSEIVLPVQTADPNNQGGRRVDVHFGVNIAGQKDIGIAGHRLALEIGLPIYQDLNGPQMETDWILSLGYQYAF